MVNWGDVPTWIQAGATVLLLLAASVAGWYTHRIYKIESGRDEKYENERRADQASKIAAWVSKKHALCLVQNASDLPIYDLSFEYRIRHRDASETVVGVDERDRLPPIQDRLNLPPDVRMQWQAASRSDDALQVRISFRDASGRRWRRDYDGRLEDLDAASEVAPGSGHLHRLLRRMPHPVKAVRASRRDRSG